MSEFSPQPAAVAPPAYTPPPNVEQHWLKRPIIWGQSIPWLTLYALILIAAGFFFFRPDPGASINGRAFGNQDLQSAPLSFDTASTAPVSSSGSLTQAASASSLAQMQNEVAGMIATLRTHSDVNRQAIEQMALKVNAMADTQALLKQQISELQAQAALQSAHNLVAPSTPARRAVAVTAKPHPVAPSSPLAGMHLSAVQNGMAWVQWQDKTWAVEVGDTLGPVTVTSIDAPSRLVHTSAGTLQ